MPFNKHGFLGQEAKNLPDKIQKEYGKYFLLVDQVNEFANSIISTIRLNPDDLQESLIGALFTKIIHSFYSSIILAQHGLESDCNTILRSLFETLFFFQAIHIDKSHGIKYLQIEKARQLKTTNVILDNIDSFKLVDEKKIADLKALRESLKNEITNERIQSLSTEEWSKKAGLHDVYQTAYRLLSLDVHTDPTSLDRFLNLDDGGKLKSFKLGPSVKDIKRNLKTASAIILDSIKVICEITKIDKAEEIAVFEKRIKLLNGQ